jgi:peptidylprolyl isomerase
MSQSRPKNRPTPPPSSAIPGLLSAVVVLLILGLIGVLLFNRGGSGSSQSTTLVPTSAAAAAVPTAASLPVNLMPTATTYGYASPPPMSIDAARQYTATITTPRGEIVIELLPKIAPVTVNNFVFLARNNFYNGLTWHRVLEGFMARVVIHGVMELAVRAIASPPSSPIRSFSIALGLWLWPAPATLIAPDHSSSLRPQRHLG